MNEKIFRFLHEAGFEGESADPAALQLLRYFEEEYDVNFLALLEREWVDEQMDREMTKAQFDVLRTFIDDRFLDDFDSTVEKIEAI